MAISIDPQTFIISIPKADLALIQASPTEIRELNLNTFRLELKAYEDDEQGMYLLKTHSHNTEVSLGGLTYARTIEILDPYTITFEDGQYAVNLVGANSNVGDVVNVNQVSVRTANSAGLISSPEMQYASFQNAVWIDPNATHRYAEGTYVYPAGSRQYPVNNLSDAVGIAGYWGFSTLQILDSMTLDDGTDLTDFKIIGKSHVDTELTIDTNAITTGIVLENANVVGVLDGNTTIRNCSVGDLSYVNGQIFNSGLYGTIYLDGDQEAVIVNCYTVDQDNYPIVDMGGSGQDLSMPNYSGIVTIQNLTSGTEEIGIGLNAGQVVLDSTITAGTIIVAGTGILVDNSGGTASVNTDGLMNKELVTKISWSTVHINTLLGTSGTAFPLGTSSSPVDNIADALTIAQANNVNRFEVIGTLVVDENVDGYIFTGGSSIVNSVVYLAGGTTAATKFERCYVTGTSGGGEGQQYSESLVVDVTNINGIMFTCGVVGTLTLEAGGLLQGKDVTGGGLPTVVDMNGAGTYFGADLYGDWLFQNIGEGTHVQAGMIYGNVYFDDTDTAGTAIASGNGRCHDESDGTVVTNDMTSAENVTSEIATAVKALKLGEFLALKDM